MDEDERAAIRDEGYDPDDPAVIDALDQVTRTLHTYRHLAWTLTNDGVHGSPARR
ncbi:hypothetical protein [Rhodococcus sp. H29-C3]|uniref:hypothetical protein n=1 Tax=Rhodococcus sp. H29-C3 TaxID=3046307 RepID=UPI0024BBA5FD|nr:hypothetical protein [Rhodococcus sp. H29-C3]MDJ0362997.1 hypothetical protein [Rhodococcus sp. H29-C3]